MAMNFFEHQDQARRRTGRLVTYFGDACAVDAPSPNRIVLPELLPELPEIEPRLTKKDPSAPSKRTPCLRPVTICTSTPLGNLQLTSNWAGML